MMNGRRIGTLFVAAVAFLFMNSPGLGQMDWCRGVAQGMDQGGYAGMGMGKGCPQFDPATEVTVSGAIEEILEHPGMRGGAGVHLLLRTAQEVLEIHLGPAALLAEQDMSLAVGDELEVIGSRMEFEDAVAVLARQVKKGDQVLLLRNQQGRHLWAGNHPGMSRQMGHPCGQRNQ